MFVYCNNSPVKLVDSDGESATIAGAIIGGAFGFIGALVSEITDDNDGVRFNKVLACAASGAATGAAIGFVADVTIATCGVGTAAILATAGAGAILSGANSAFTQNTLTGSINYDEVLCDGILGGLTSGLGAATSSMMEPVAKGVKEGIKYTCSKISSEVFDFAAFGQIGRPLLEDIGFAAVTNFGAWYGKGMFGLVIGWD